MNSPRTTYFAIAAAVGAFLWDLASVPYWVNVVGKCLVIAGTSGAGISAADGRKLDQHTAEIQQLRNDTQSITKP